jgi:hypothetical protein
MSPGKSRQPKESGDLQVLRRLCEIHGLQNVWETAKKQMGTRRKNGCSAGTCQSDCSITCKECYLCINDCTLAE